MRWRTILSWGCTMLSLGSTMGAAGCGNSIAGEQQERTLRVQQPLTLVPLPAEILPGDPDGWWRQQLIDFMASFSSSDFTLAPQTLPPFDDTGSYYGSSPSSYTALSKTESADIERAWVAESSTLPVAQLLAIPDQCFTLPYIEGTTASQWPEHGLDVNLYWIEPDPTAGSYGVLYSYNSPINPYAGSIGVLNRAAVTIALTLIKLDTIHKTKSNGNLANLKKSSHQFNTNWTDYAIADGYTADLDDDWIASSYGPQPPRYVLALGNSRNKVDKLAQPLEDLAVEYMTIRDALTAAQQLAFDEAFVRLGSRLSAWGFSHQQMNRITTGPNALLVTAKLSNNPVAMSDYLNYVNEVYVNRFHSAGYFADDTGWDASYNGYNLLHAGRLLRLEEHLASQTGTTTTSAYPVVKAAFEKMLALKAHLQVLDPGSSAGLPFQFQYSPNHYNSRTDGDSSWGQGGKRLVPFNGVAVDIDAAIPFLRGWAPTDLHQLNVGSPDDRGKTLSSVRNGQFYTATLENARTNPGKYAAPSQICATATPLCGPSDGCCPISCSASADSDCYTGVRPFQLDDEDTKNYYRPGTELITHKFGIMTQWDAKIAADPNVELYPVEKPGDAIQIFGDEFGFAKFGNYAAMVHAGDVGSFEGPATRFPCVAGSHPECLPDSNGDYFKIEWDVAHLPAGYGGGMLSYFWSAKTGGSIIGRRKSRYDKGASPAEAHLNMDDWSVEPSWPLHRVLFTTVDGRTTTSARIQQPTRTLTPHFDAQGDPQDLTVLVSGVIPAGSERFGNGAPNGPPNVLAAPISFRRDFVLDANGVHVQTALSEQTPAVDSFSSIVETIPFQMYGCRRQLLHNPSLAPIQIWLYQSNATAPILAQAGSWTTGVYMVEQVRFGEKTRVTFDTPQTVTLSQEWVDWFSNNGAADCTPGTQSWMRTQNLIIDVLGNAGGSAQQLLSAKSIGYTITAL